MATQSTTQKPAAASAAKKRTSVPTPEAATASSSAVDAVAAGTLLVHEIPLGLIDSHPRNPRQQLGDLGELAESIRVHGVKQPVTVIPHPETPGRHMTVMGHRRVAAALVAGRATVPAIVDDTMGEAEQLQVMLVENLQRVDLTISEEGTGYQGLLDLGVSKAEIARRTGRAKNTVDTRLKVAGMAEPVQRHVDQHQLTIEDAITFTEWRDTHADVYAEQLEKLSNPHVMVDVVLGEAKRVVKERANVAEAVAEWTKRGQALIVGPCPFQYGDVHGLSKLNIGNAAHDHCPGAQVYIEYASWIHNVSGYGRFVCTDPEKFHPDEYKAASTPPGQRELTPDQIAQNEYVAAANAARAAERAESEAVATARRTWLTTTLTRVDPDSAPTYAALADVAATAARLLLAMRTSPHETWLFDTGFYPSDALPEDVTLPTNSLSVLILTLLLTLEAGLPDAPTAIDDMWPAAELTLVIDYLNTCAAHGHTLHERETLLIRAAEFALDNQKTEATPDNDNESES